MSTASETIERLIKANVGFSFSYLTKLHSLSLQPMHTDQMEEQLTLCTLPEILDGDMSWAGETVVEALRSDLEKYLEVIRRLRQERRVRANKKFQVKDHFRDIDFNKMIKDEATYRVSKDSVQKFFKSIDLSGRKLSEVDDGMQYYTSLDELFVTSCRLPSLGLVPTSIRILCAEDNDIQSIQTLTAEHKLAHLGLALNLLTHSSLEPLTKLPHLFSLDLSYNRIVNLVSTCDTLMKIPTLRKLSLMGNPCALCTGYRQYVVSRLPVLEVFDDIPLETSTTPPQPSDATPCNTFQIEVTLEKILGVANLPRGEEAERPQTGGGGKAPAKAPPAKGKGKAEAQETPAAPRRCIYLSLQSSEIVPGLSIVSGEIDVANIMSSHNVVAEAEKPSKGTKKGPEAPQPVSSGASADTLPLNQKIAASITIEENTAAVFLRPVAVTVSLVERMIVTDSNAEALSSAGGADSPKKEASHLLGTFQVDIAGALQGGKCHCKTDLIGNEFYMKCRREALAQLIRELEAATVEFDAEKQKLQRPDTDSGAAVAVASSKTAAKPKAKGPAAAAAEEETPELKKLKKAVERLQDAVTKEEVDIAKGPPALTLHMTLELNPTKETVQVVEEKKDAKAKKK